MARWDGALDVYTPVSVGIFIRAWCSDFWQNAVEEGTRPCHLDFRGLIILCVCCPLALGAVEGSPAIALYRPRVTVWQRAWTAYARTHAPRARRRRRQNEQRTATHGTTTALFPANARIAQDRAAPPAQLPRSACTIGAQICRPTVTAGPRWRLMRELAAAYFWVAWNLDGLEA